jgi:signal transduction histidine kinase
MRGSTSLIDRAVLIGRRQVAAPEGLLVVGLVLGLLATIEVVLRTDLGFDRSSTALSTAILLGLGATLPIAGVRTHLVAATAAIASAAFLALLTDGRPTVVGTVTLAASLYWVGRRHRGPAAALVVLPFVVYAVFAVADPGTSAALPVALASVTAGSVGLGRARRLRGEARARNATRQTMTDAFQEYAARGERARIARELHDVVAHHISMIAVQAETARLATPGLPPAGVRQLLAIGDTARTALTEMRRLLGVLREDADTDTTRQPQPGLHQLIELVDEARERTNATTRLVVRGGVAPLDRGIELTAYRIVQEASPMPAGTRPAQPSTWSSTTPPTRCMSASGTTVQDRPPRLSPTAPPPAATASSGCASAPPPSAATCGPVRRGSVVFSWRRRSRRPG